MIEGYASRQRLHQPSFRPIFNIQLQLGIQFLQSPCKWSVIKFINILVYCKLLKYMEQYQNFFELLSSNRGNFNWNVTAKFPLDGQKSVQKVINHPGTKELWVNLLHGMNKEQIKKKMVDYYSQLLRMCECEQEKSVCARIVKGGDTVAECYQCRADESCIICMDCFKNGNHKGHRVVFKRAGGGCCDCGDVQAWSEQGFCSKHTGKVKEINITPDQINRSSQILFELFFIYSFMKLSGNKGTSQFFSIYTYLLQTMILKSLKGIKIISIFLDTAMPEKYKISSKLQGKVLSQILKIEFTAKDFRYWQNIFIAMFPYYPFKQLLIAGYIKYFQSIFACENVSGTSISCQIMTSYKLIEDYVDSEGATPIIIKQHLKISEAYHLTKILGDDLNRINHLQGNAALKYWNLQIKHGIIGLFGYYESLKNAARKQKQKHNEQIIQTKKKTEMLQKQDEDTKFSIFDFLVRQNRIIQCQFALLAQFLQILPVLAGNQQLLFNLIRQIVNLTIQQITNDDNLIIFRPYQRMLGLVLFYISQQTPCQLTNPQLRALIRQASGLNQQKWEWWLNAIQQRMIQTFCFYTHIQTCQNQNYHHSFYAYIMLYNAKYCILGYTDILLIKQLIFLGAPEIKLDFSKLVRLQRFQPSNTWNMKIISTLVNEISILFIGYFAEIFLGFYGTKSNPPVWIRQQAKRALKKFITAEGGSSTLQKIKSFSDSFIFQRQEVLKEYLRQICIFNKQKKWFQLLPINIDRDPINFINFSLRAKISNQSLDSLHPKNTLQLIDKANKVILSSIWNRVNLESLRFILLLLHDQIQARKSKDELVQYFSLPCLLSYLLKNIQVSSDTCAPLTQILQNFDVNSQVRKVLGPLANQLSPVMEQNQIGGRQLSPQKQLQKQKKQRKLDQLKKRNFQNVQKVKQKHQLASLQNQNLDQCVICKKTGGNLVWVAKMSLKNLQRIMGHGEGALALSFTSCYHCFDYECILQNTVKRSTHQVLFRCPVCRSLGNILFPINVTENSQMYIDATMDRIMQVALTLRNYKQFDIVDQILKSFYHYVLLGYLQHQYVRQKRLRLYKQILNLFLNMKDSEKITIAEKHLQENKIILLPKLAKDTKQQINLKEADIGIIDEDDYDDDQFQQLYGNYRDIKKKNLQKQLQEKEKLKQEKKKNKKSTQQQTDIFYYTLRRIINYIKEKRPQIQNKMISQQMEIKGSQQQVNQNKMEQKIQIQVLKKQQKIIPSWVNIILDQLIDQPSQLLQQWVSPKLINIVNLPDKYYWDMCENSCDFCEKICGDLFLCLHCKWKGCLNNCKKGGLKMHNKKDHGENGAFFRLNDAIVYIMFPGDIKKVGCLYLNEWGEDFDIKKDWDKYYLQKSVLEQAIRTIIKDE